MAAAKKVVRQLWTMARYEIKRNGSVCHVTINDKGEKHHTWLHANGATGCDCESRCGKCYHRDYVRAQEAKRQPVVSTAAQPIVEVTHSGRPYTAAEYRELMARNKAWQEQAKEADREKLRRVKAAARVEHRAPAA